MHTCLTVRINDSPSLPFSFIAYHAASSCHDLSWSAIPAVRHSCLETLGITPSPPTRPGLAKAYFLWVFLFYFHSPYPPSTGCSSSRVHWSSSVSVGEYCDETFLSWYNSGRIRGTEVPWVAFFLPYLDDRFHQIGEALCPLLFKQRTT